MDDELRRLRDCALKRERYRAAAAQAEADTRRLAEEARRAGATEEDIERAMEGKPTPRLVRAREYPRSTARSDDGAASEQSPRQPPPKRVDLESEGWWGDGNAQ